MMTQTIALFVDAYRELNAKKLFWITMILSGLVVAVYAAVGINEEGVHFLWFRLTFLPDHLNSTVLPPAMLYKQLFLALGIGIWLTWIAAVLALVSTAGIIPEMISGGSIEMLLSKPISRFRLFLTKYLTGLLFATLQVGVFTIASFLVIGIRGGAWEPSLFLAVPIVVCFFSYLFGVCALLGVLMRSTIASLLLTILFWFCVFIVNQADNTLLMFKSRAELELERAEAAIETSRESVSRILIARHAGTEEALPEGYVATDEDIRAMTPWSARTFEAREEARGTIENIDPWLTGIFITKTVLPKTQETVGLLERWLISMADLKSLSEMGEEDDDRPAPPSEAGGEVNVEDEQVSLRLQEKLRDRSPWWIVGTSLLFEAFVVGLAALVFARRDH